MQEVTDGDAQQQAEPVKKRKHTFFEKLVGNDDWDTETGEYHGLER